MNYVGNPSGGVLRRLQKEVQDLTVNPPPEGISLGPLPEDMFHWQATILGPPNTPYEGGLFVVDLEIPRDYPFRPPKNRFLTKVYHPNIDSHGRHCLDIDHCAWSPALTLKRLVCVLSSLLENINPEDPLVPDIAHIYKTDPAMFQATARAWTTRYAMPQGEAHAGAGGGTHPE
ncbi:Ubiquitin-conjugating enzyme E2 D4-like [Balamuthia mandrillaris]